MPLPTLAVCRSTSVISTSPRASAMLSALLPTLLQGRTSWFFWATTLCLTATSATRCSPFPRSTVASVIAVAACSPEEVSRYGVIAGERVGSLEGAEGVADAEPGAVWRIGGLVEKPAPEAAPSNLYIVGRYLLSPLVMDLLADQQAGKGGEIQLTDAMARSLDREAMYAVVIDPLSGYDTGTPSGWMATNALMAASDPRFDSAFWDAIDERGGLMRK